MDKHCFTKFYRVFKNETAVTEVSFNDFRHIERDFGKELIKGDLVDELFSIPYHTYSLLAKNERYSGFLHKTQALEKAKSDALKHIETLLLKGVESSDRLYQYRFDHYEDLNFTLTDSNIRRLERAELNSEASPKL